LDSAVGVENSTKEGKKKAGGGKRKVKIVEIDGEASTSMSQR
jgi:hypothetical protein